MVDDAGKWQSRGNRAEYASLVGMRVLFTTSNWAGHWFCMVPLGWALQAAGHEVRVLCPPAQAAAVRQTGLPVVPVLKSVDMMYVARLTRYADVVRGRISPPWPPIHPWTGERVEALDDFDVEAAEAEFIPDYYAAVRHTYEQALDYATSWRPELVCHDVMSEEGALAARELGIPSVYYAPGLFGTVDDELGLDLGLRDMVNNAARPGVEPWARDQIELVIDSSPAAALPPMGDARRLPVRYVPYNGPGELAEWVWRRRPKNRVCVMWGRSATGIFGPDVPALRAAVEAAAGLGAEVVLTASQEQVAALGELPEGVRVLADFPLHVLLSAGCTAFVHHGSDNALMNGAVAGVPQVSLSLASDQIVFGERMSRTGAVLTLPGLTASPEQVGEAVGAVLGDPGYAKAAGVLREELLSYPAPSELVATLAGLAGH
jgi:UDP:flavonoid glycosyltransferase YjiC (YdhE family)